MKKKLKDFKDKFFLLYGSNNKDFGNDGLLILSLVLCIIGVYFFILVAAGKIITKGEGLDCMDVAWLYMVASSIIGGIFLNVLYFYIYNENKIKNERFIQFLKCFAWGALIICFVIFIPWIIFTAIILKIVSYRAKTTDNFAAFLLMLVTNLLIVAASLKLEIEISYVDRVYELLSKFIAIRLEPAEIFLILAITEIAVLAVNEIVFFAMRRTKGKAALKEVEAFKETLLEKIGKRYARNSKKKIAIKNAENDAEKLARKKDKEIRRDITYLRNTLLKTHLFAMICIFIWAILSTDSEVMKISSDIVNVVTVFTLIILYIDKRRELGSF